MKKSLSKFGFIDLIIIFIVLFIAKETVNFNTIFKKVERVNILENNINYYKELESNLTKLEVKFPNVVIAQIMHETDKLQSSVYKSCNNLVGMKYNNRGFAAGECRGHALYLTPGDCLRDYKAYQDKYLPLYEKRKNKKVISEEDYIQFLVDQNYAEDTNYYILISKWLEIVKQKSEDKWWQQLS